MVDKKFIDEALKAHNAYRDRHKVSALKHNKEISAIAQRWADHLAKTGTFQHSNDRSFKGEKLGENIAMKWSSGGGDFTGQMVTNQWYSEVTKHNFSANSGGGSGHFTQVVWKGSREFGIGRAQGRDGKWIVVGNYYPAGNFMGRYTENVFPAKDGKTALMGEDKPSSAGGKDDFSRPMAASGFDSGRREPLSSGFSDSSGGGRSVSTSTRTVTEGFGANKVTKTIVTETVVGPDGQKTTTTRETVTRGDGGSAAPSGGSGGALAGSDFDSRFRDMNIGSSGGSAPPKQSSREFIDDVVKFHNKYRKQHRVGDLRHNPELDGVAQSWADNLARREQLAHSNATYRGQELGENVASKWSTGGADYTGQQVVDQWYSEVSKFDFGRGEFTQGTGHFTQVVWKDSKEVGVGKAHSRDGSRVYVVCNYHPAGNVMGRFRENVFPG